MNFFRRIVLTVGVFFFSFIFSYQETKAVGISPSLTEIENLANGVTVTRTVYVSRGDGTGEKFYSVKTGGEAARFIVISDETVKMENGQRQAPINFKIKPMGAANGVYGAELLITETIDPNLKLKGDNAVAVMGGVVARVNFSVTDKEYKDFKVRNISLSETEVNIPAAVNFLAQNNGNVEARPDRIEFTLADKTDPSNVIMDTILATGIKLSLPGAETMTYATMNKSLSLGEYVGEVVFFYDGKEIARQVVSLKVWPQGTLAQSGTFGEFTIEPTNPVFGDLIKLKGSIVNSGEINIEPVFVVDVKLNGKSVALLRSEKKMLPKNATVEFLNTLKLEKNGEYTFDGYFEFGIKQTDHKEITLKIGGAGWLLYTVLAILTLAIIAGITWFLVKRHHHVESHKKPTHIKKK